MLTVINFINLILSYKITKGDLDCARKIIIAKYEYRNIVECTPQPMGRGRASHHLIKESFHHAR